MCVSVDYFFVFTKSVQNLLNKIYLTSLFLFYNEAKTFLVVIDKVGHKSSSPYKYSFNISLFFIFKNVKHTESLI